MPYPCFDELDEGVIVLDPDGTIVWLNEPFQEIFGISRETVRGISADRFVKQYFAPLANDEPDTTQILAVLLNRAEVSHLACRLRTLQEEVRCFALSCRVMTGEQHAGMMLVRLRDITEQKRTEEALRQSERRYRQLIESSPDAIVIHTDGKIVFVNRACVKLLGAAGPEELIGRQAIDFVHPDFKTMVHNRIHQLQYGETVTVPRIGEQFLRVDGKTVEVEVTAVPLTYEGRRSVLVIVHDITDRKQAEEALARQTEDLIVLNRELEATRDEANLYLDIMTHDVRNVNNVSGMYADLLVELLAGDQWLYARKLRDAIQRSTEILKNVDTIRKIQQGKDGLVPIDLDTVIREEIKNYRGASICYEGAPVTVRADGLLPMIFTNLVGNAIKFGWPEVEIAIRIEDRDSEILVTVADTGPGVPDEMKEKLFHRFERGKAKGKGEGLGLFICRTLVERYGGMIWIEDRVSGRPEEGAAFKFTLGKVASDTRKHSPQHRRVRTGCT
jgi:PAS domain S-box-containing protein